MANLDCSARSASALHPRRIDHLLSVSGSEGVHESASGGRLASRPDSSLSCCVWPGAICGLVGITWTTNSVSSAVEFLRQTLVKSLQDRESEFLSARWQVCQQFQLDSHCLGEGHF